MAYQKTIVSLVILICFLFMPASNVVMAGDVPSSSRSKSAEERKIPILINELDMKGMILGDPVFIRIFKEEAQLEVWIKSGNKYSLFKSYPICTFSGKLGPKLKEGDRQSPEGFYFVKSNQHNPNSSYHLSFNIGFPNKLDRILGRTGSYLMVHGSCVSIGCYAMTNNGIEEIWTLAIAAIRKGQPFYRVHIFPFRMTDKNMLKHKDNRWIGWWKNLKDGYDFFEENRLPPDVSVKDEKYSFSH